MNENLVDKVVNQWGSREYKGRGRLTIPAYFNSRAIILRLLQRIYENNHPKVFIVVDNFNTRTQLVSYFTNQECESNNQEFKELIKRKVLVIVTEDLFNKMNYMFADTYLLFYNVVEYGERTRNRISICRFIFDISSYKKDIPVEVESIPILTAISSNELDNVRATTPVEEYQIGVHIPKDSDDYKELDKLTTYITKALNIFGDFDTISKARVGDPEHNLSSNDICIQIAKDNGWSDHLDMSLAYNQKLDETYNPNELADLAFNTYDFIRERKNLLSSYKGKIDSIKQIIKDNGGSENVSNLIIICKKATFAIQVADELNRVYGENFCRAICDKVESVPAVDINGNPIYFKSGAHKGERKYMGSAAQQTLYNNWYNMNKIKCLVLSNAPSNKLKCSVSDVIITSPSCMTIEEYMYRLPYITYPNNKITLYSLFCVDTQEQKQILNEKLTKFHKIVKNSEQVDDNGNFVPKIFVD